MLVLLTLKVTGALTSFLASFCYNVCVACQTGVSPGVGTYSNSGFITAEVCNSTSYDASNSIAWGVQPRPCTRCPTNMVTSCSSVANATQRAACEADLALYRNAVSGGFVSRSACKTLPGFGWSGQAAAVLCGVGSFSTGGHNSSCTSCNNEPANFLQTAGMTAAAQCLNCGSFGLILAADVSTCGEQPQKQSIICSVAVQKVEHCRRCASLQRSWRMQAACNSKSFNVRCVRLTSWTVGCCCCYCCWFTFAELPVGSAGTSSGGATTHLTAVNVSSLTGIADCPDSHYCPGGSPVGAGVPQACPVGITVQAPPGTSRSACNCES